MFFSFIRPLYNPVIKLVIADIVYSIMQTLNSSSSSPKWCYFSFFKSSRVYFSFLTPIISASKETKRRSNLKIQTKNNINVESLERRTADYKPNIWSYDKLQSLTTIYDEPKYRRELEVLKEQISTILSGAAAVEDPIYKLELIDMISKLALSHYFTEEIKEAMNELIISSCMKKRINSNTNEDNYLYANMLYFRILRQHGYYVSQDEFHGVMGNDKFMITTSANLDAKAKLEIFEASHLAMEDECLLDDDRAKAFAIKNLIIRANNCPLHWSVCWFNVKKYIHDQKYNSILLRLARHSFNIVQAQHQKDLKEILTWWRNLGLLEDLTFARDRVVESFMWAVGVAYEPQYASLRKWLTKVIIFILIIDDLYDIYGSQDELERFTAAVDRWDPSEIEQLPEAIKRCFWALYDTTNDMDREIQKEKGWNSSVLPHLNKVWADFCKALLVEAKWYQSSHTPTLQEYLDNGWISSSGPMLSLYILFGVGDDHLTETISVLNNNQEIIHHVSQIIRLYNDQGTSQAELERGDASSSILCYMREANATEEAARDHIRNLITYSWKKINRLYIMNTSPSQKPMIRYVINLARAANSFYQDRDGFGVQDQETREQVLSCLIEPLPIV